MSEFRTVDFEDDLRVAHKLPHKGRPERVVFGIKDSSGKAVAGSAIPMSEVVRLHAYLGEVLARQGAKP